jgi:CcmD family protein
MRTHTSRLATALAAALLLLAAPLASARAQGGSAPATNAAAPPTVDAPASASTEPQPATTGAASNGLPTEPAPPRTFRAYWHVWIAFTLAWLLLFGYVVSVGRRFGKLEREVEALGG